MQRGKPDGLTTTVTTKMIQHLQTPSRMHGSKCQSQSPCPVTKFLIHQKLAPVFHVKGLMYRKLLEVIKAAYEDPSAEQVHISPYEEYWQPPGPNSPPERIYSELYNSNAFILVHEKVRSQLRHGCELETVIAAIMLSSDFTHLTSFGIAGLWPIYLYLGGLSKYPRTKPSSFAAHHLAYVPKVIVF